MATVIWKFPVPIGAGAIEMPQGARIISAGTDETSICVWAICDPHAALAPRRVAVFATGVPLRPDDDLLTHVSSFTVRTPLPSVLVCHVFAEQPS